MLNETFLLVKHSIILGRADIALYLLKTSNFFAFTSRTRVDNDYKYYCDYGNDVGDGNVIVLTTIMLVKMAYMMRLVIQR